MLAQYLTPTVESIDHQYDGLLMNDLSVLLGRLTDAPDVNLGKITQEIQPQIEKVIFSRTGINVSFNIVDVPFLNAMVRVPQIDRNHPLLTDFHREVYRSDGIRKVKDKKTILNGKVDRAKARVSGVFSDIKVPVIMTKAMFTANYFEPNELAAVAIHELGHVFTYYEYLGTAITTNFILSDVTRELLNTKERKRRYQIAKEGCKALDIEIDDIESLISSDSDVVIQTVLLRSVMEKRVSELGSPTHDLTAWEALSDQFVSRHGGGRSLVTGMDKMNRLYGGESSYMTTWEYHTVEAMKLLMVVVGSLVVFAPLVILYLMAFVNTNENVYDKEKARFERIRRDMVNSVKNPKLDKASVQRITEDIEVIDTVLEEMQDRRTYLQFFWSTLRTKGRRNYQQLQFQQELEILVNNDVFVRAAKLRTITL